MYLINLTLILIFSSFYKISMQTLKVLRTADFAPLVVFIAPTNTAPQVLYFYLNILKYPETPNSISLQLLILCVLSPRRKTCR